MYHNDRGVIVMKRRKRMLFLVAPLLLLSACNSEMEGDTNNEKKYISSIQKRKLMKFNILLNLILLEAP